MGSASGSEEEEEGRGVKEEEEEEEEEEEQEAGYDSDEEGSVIYRSEKVAGSVTLESSPSTSSVYEHPVHRSRGLGAVSESEDEGEGTEEDEVEDIEEEVQQDGGKRKLEEVEIITEKQELQVEKQKAGFCTVATQTDILSPLPAPAHVQGQGLTTDVAMQSAEQLVTSHSSIQLIRAAENWSLERLKAEVLKIVHENTEEKRRARLARKASRKNLSVGVESRSTGESSSSSDDEGVGGDELLIVPIPEQDVEEVPAVTAPTPAEIAALTPMELPSAPAEALALASPPATATPEPTTLTTTKGVQTAICGTHYTIYVNTTNHFHWLKILAFLLFVIVVTRKYFDMQQEHLYECAYPPTFKCLCLPEWLDLEEPICKCIFWPKTC